MECKNHAGVPALDRCTACAEAFCKSCLVEIHGQNYCGSCKVVTLKRKTAPLEDAQRRLCPESKEALTFAIVGQFICAIIFCPVALSKASSAKTKIRRNPAMDGRGVATAAQVIAVGGLLLWLFFMAVNAILMNQ
jgi:hypothetical protein